MASVVAENISKSFTAEKKKVLALEDISFEVNKGAIFGVIGPGWSGKNYAFQDTDYTLTRG